MNINANSLVLAYDAFFALPTDQEKKDYFKTHWVHNNGEISKKSAIAATLTKLCCLISKIHHKIFGISNEQPLKLEEQFKKLRDDFLIQKIKVDAQKKDAAGITYVIPDAIRDEKCIFILAVFGKYIIKDKDDALSKSLETSLDADIGKSFQNIKFYDELYQQYQKTKTFEDKDFEKLLKI